MRNLLLSLFTLTFVSGFSQIIPNGKIDNIDELSLKDTTFTLTKDGIKLATDISLPVIRDSVTADIVVGGAPYTIQLIPKNAQYIIYDTSNISANNFRMPIIFTRTPYDKNSDAIGGRLFTFLGYAYAMQDMRGRYSSEGVYFPMYSDSWQKYDYHPTLTIPMDLYPSNNLSNALRHSDGSEAVFYLADSLYRTFDVDMDGTPEVFKYSNGVMGMYGASALGNSQYQALSNIPHSVANNPIKCLMPIVAANEHYNSTLFHNGVYRYSLSNGWITGQMMALNDTLAPFDLSLTNTLHTPADYGYTNKADLTKDLLDWFVANDNSGFPSGAHPTTPFRADLDASFAPVNTQGQTDVNGTFSRYKNLNKPIYHLTGWWDIFINGQIETFNRTRNANPASKQKIIIGPWTHQTIGAKAVGDEIYPDNVYDVLGFDMNVDMDSLFSDSLLINSIYESELLNWFRSHLGGEPFFFIPESNTWQTIGSNLIRVPSKNYMIPYYEFLNYLGGKSPLNNLPVEINIGGNIMPLVYSLPILTSPVFKLHKPLYPYNPAYFNSVKDVRLYVSGPSNDIQNPATGNYWVGLDSLPFSNGISREKFYLHQNQTANKLAPVAPEGTLTYTADPNNPVITIGGNNMIPTVPGGGKKSQGSMDVANPLYAPHTLNRPDVLAFETAALTDTLLVVGFPRASLYAKGHTTTQATAKTDYDLMVRVIDVYPDGREMFITEGVVNAKAREYAKSIFAGQQNDNIVLDNINNNTFYHFEFEMLPLGHTFGIGHKIKFLLSSSNFPKYQSNPHIPHNPNQFFRWSPGDTSGYNYNGSWLYAQEAQITFDFNPTYPSYIELPKVTSWPQQVSAFKQESTFDIFPNPAQQQITIRYEGTSDAAVSIYSILGNAAYTGFIRVNEMMQTIDISKLSNGIYFIVLTDENGIRTSKKMVKN